MDTSAIGRCTAGSYAEEDGTVVSPDCRKPKKKAHAVAHSIALSNDAPPASQQCFSDPIMLAVMGKLVRGELPRLEIAYDLFMPCKTKYSPAIWQIFGS